MRPQTLTGKQKRVLDNIRLYIRAKGEPPTLDELRKNLGFQSLRTVTQYLEALERKGYITRHKFSRRSIELRPDEHDSPNHTISVPVIANVGCDDLSVFAQEEASEYLEVDPALSKGGEIVAVRAIGDSMLDAGIHSGDYVLIRFTEVAENGDRVAAIVGDMVTVKRLQRTADATILYPESKDPKYKPIILRQDFRIAGKVLCVIPAMSADLTDMVPM